MVFFSERKSSIFVFWAVPGSPREPLQKVGGFPHPSSHPPPPSGGVSRALGAAQNSKIKDLRSAQTPCIKNPSVNNCFLACEAHQEALVLHLSYFILFFVLVGWRSRGGSGALARSTCSLPPCRISSLPRGPSCTETRAYEACGGILHVQARDAQARNGLGASDVVPPLQ